ncbi:Maph72 [Matsumuraeses phaseoli granulovirus]|uniref:Maph72 n=1 Tax=Matsumuraeses phaseoli granulovirus TaxID=2760664 RepID=A0AAE7MLE2_9BBAC|nr:Maph72 [Matsumuraeses phaseoli granulovirus]QOD40035.1 Maph72 [Matsumuraeses phaseoli granulovirus]
MTSVIDSQNYANQLYIKYVTLYDFIEILENDLPPPRLQPYRQSRSSSLYPTLPTAQNFKPINTYCHLIFSKNIDKKRTLKNFTPVKQSP